MKNNNKIKCGNTVLFTKNSYYENVEVVGVAIKDFNIKEEHYNFLKYVSKNKEILEDDFSFSKFLIFKNKIVLLECSRFWKEDFLDEDFEFDKNYYN
jgi:hypothetical protein